MSATLDLTKPWHKRHDDFEIFDKITMEVVPRYKESGLSGDEWRQHIEVVFWFKGHEVKRHGARDMNAAAMLLGAWLIDDISPIPPIVRQVEEDSCDQPSCTEPPVARYILKEEFSAQGEKLDATDRTFKHYRQFCAKHGTRGDCGREDCDDNYIKEPL